MSNLPEVTSQLVSRVAAALAGLKTKDFAALDADKRKELRQQATIALRAERQFVARAGAKSAKGATKKKAG